MRILSNLKILLLIFIFTSCFQNDKEIIKKNVLYNGIILPEQWPPRYDKPSEPEEMPVPYLDNKPEVMQINIGRQLFVDDFLISETDLVCVHHQAVFYKRNPILDPYNNVLDPFNKSDAKGDSPPYAAPFSDGVWFDETEQKFKMWYMAGCTYHNGEPLLCTGYAESDDGKRWEKPKLGIYDQTNIVDIQNRDSQTIWLDKQEKDPKKRYKMFKIVPTVHGCVFMLRYSADGINWSDGIASSGELGDRSTAFFNPFRNIWSLSIRSHIDPIGRSRIYLENEDPAMAVSLAHRIIWGLPDKNLVYWFTSSDKDPRNPLYPDVTPAIYNFDAIAYESIMLGFFCVWQGPENNICRQDTITKRNEIMLGYSRDGFHFSRPCYKPFMGVDNKKGAWNGGNVQSVNGVPIIVGDSLYFYFSGRRQPENIEDVDKYMSTGLATLRRDGFVSVKSGKNEGYLITEKVNFDGDYFFVNADVEQGQLAVEILNEQKMPVKGFTKKDCIVMRQINSTKHLLMWNNNKNISALKGENIFIKFYLTNGDLYSFWITPWVTGESRGYTAGGGPELCDDGIDRPIN